MASNNTGLATIISPRIFASMSPSTFLLQTLNVLQLVFADWQVQCFQHISRLVCFIQFAHSVTLI